MKINNHFKLFMLLIIFFITIFSSPAFKSEAKGKDQPLMIYKIGSFISNPVFVTTLTKGRLYGDEAKIGMSLKQYNKIGYRPFYQKKYLFSLDGYIVPVDKTYVSKSKYKIEGVTREYPGIFEATDLAAVFGKPIYINKKKKLSIYRVGKYYIMLRSYSDSKHTVINFGTRAAMNYKLYTYRDFDGLIPASQEKNQPPKIPEVNIPSGSLADLKNKKLISLPYNIVEIIKGFKTLINNEETVEEQILYYYRNLNRSSEQYQKLANILDPIEMNLDNVSDEAIIFYAPKIDETMAESVRQGVFMPMFDFVQDLATNKNAQAVNSILTQVFCGELDERECSLQDTVEVNH